MGVVELADSLIQFYIHRAVFNAMLKLTDVQLAINILMETLHNFLSIRCSFPGEYFYGIKR